ncbi:hypothetical protein LOK49_LG03G02931 [Camellia lanceoleosa]|uniref:Uncharacterized protein n=1 Tax=Camellia lanceoleosa TaxID=1840588 RepID=A0ACC0IFP7_9ERIC|nr:hypothetical protein LOK49_LG03G02931 [Camellia lanceoleosa]
MIQAFYENELLQFSDNHRSLQCNNTTLQSQGDPHNAVNDIQFARSWSSTKHKARRRNFSKNSAKRRWRMLFKDNEVVLGEEECHQEKPFEEINELSIAPSRAINPSICAIEVGIAPMIIWNHSQPTQRSLSMTFSWLARCQVAKTKLETVLIKKREGSEKMEGFIQQNEMVLVKRNVAEKPVLEKFQKL